MFQNLGPIALASICFSFATVEELTLEEKVGQLFMAHFVGENVNEDAKALIQDVHVGAVIYYNWTNGLTSPSQVQKLSSELQKLARETRLSIPLFIAADQEGGLVARLTQGFTVFPGNRALGATNNSDLAERSSYAIGQEMRSVGVNMNLAPVVDINSNAQNPVIGIRSFGDVPETVLAFGEKALQGYNRAQVVACLKHFPGHGEVSVDSHEDLPVVNKSIEELERGELLPFAKLGLQADAIMTAHILVPALDPDNCSTLSKKTLTYLRETIGFEGVIVADSLVMEGVLKKCDGSVEEATIQALDAGCDLVIFGGRRIVSGSSELPVSDVQRIHGKVMEAVKSGRLSEERLNQSVQRILRLKERYLNRPSEIMPLENHQLLAREIASLSLKTIENDPSCCANLNQKRVAVIAPQLMKESIDQTALLSLGKTTEGLFFSGLCPSVQEVAAIEESAKTADIVIFCSYNAWKNESQKELIKALVAMGKPVILLVLRDPLDAELFPKANLIFTTFSPTAPSIQAVCDRLR
jgi:beta-N-acetylhexosaminidase